MIRCYSLRDHHGRGTAVTTVPEPKSSTTALSKILGINHKANVKNKLKHTKTNLCTKHQQRVKRKGKK